MHIESFRNYCLSLPEVEEKMPFEKFFHGRHSLLAFYARGKMFCYFDIDAFDLCTLRCPEAQINELKARYQSVGKPYNGDPRHWIGICPGGDMPDDVLKALVRQSYELAIGIKPL